MLHCTEKRKVGVGRRRKQGRNESRDRERDGWKEQGEINYSSDDDLDVYMYADSQKQWTNA